MGEVDNSHLHFDDEAPQRGPIRLNGMHERIIRIDQMWDLFGGRLPTVSGTELNSTCAPQYVTVPAVGAACLRRQIDGPQV